MGRFYKRKFLRRSRKSLEHIKKLSNKSKRKSKAKELTRKEKIKYAEIVLDNYSH